MRKADGKVTGYVLLPLFLEMQENETIEEALERTDFEDPWDVLQAMQEQDGVLAEIIREMREQRGQIGGFDDSRLRERVEVLGPEVSLDILRDVVSTAVVDRLGVAWDERYGELKRYKDQFGHCNVPRRRAQNRQLATWVAVQRLSEGQGRLSAERKARLDKLGFVWDPYAAQWEEGYAHLQAFVRQHGHCSVLGDHKTTGGYQLGSWVKNQRTTTDRMLVERKTRLDALGFVWSRKR
jgi:Helicase associated domain